MGLLVREPGTSQRTGEAGPGLWHYIVLMIMPLAILLAGLALLTYVQDAFGITAEIALVFVIGLSVIALLLALSTTAIFFSWVRLTDRNSPLGLPEGSIRAVIALSLIIIFAIMAIYFYNDVAGRPVTDTSETAQDLAQQVITTVSTLVVAVAGFYFGTSAVKTAQGVTERASLRVLRPKSPRYVVQGGRSVGAGERRTHDFPRWRRCNLGSGG